jgi:2-oxoglutarate dehydrogenase E1 component
MTDDSHFERYIPESNSEELVTPEEIKRHILCSGIYIVLEVLFELYVNDIIYLGQVYYTLVEERKKRGINNIAISRVEQISPFPYDLVCSLAIEDD